MEIIELAIMGNLKGLQQLIDNPETPAIQVGLAQSMVRAINHGDWDVLESIMGRIIGKVPDKIQVEKFTEKIEIAFVDP